MPPPEVVVDPSSLTNVGYSLYKMSEGQNMNRIVFGLGAP
jgi:hypothetical protein